MCHSANGPVKAKTKARTAGARLRRQTGLGARPANSIGWRNGALLAALTEPLGVTALGVVAQNNSDSLQLD